MVLHLITNFCKRFAKTEIVPEIAGSTVNVIPGSIRPVLKHINNF